MLTNTLFNCVNVLNERSLILQCKDILAFQELLNLFLTLAIVTWSSPVASLKDDHQVFGDLSVVIAPDLVRLIDALHLLAIVFETVELLMKRPECIISFEVRIIARSLLQFGEPEALRGIFDPFFEVELYLANCWVLRDSVVSIEACYAGRHSKAII